MTTVTSIIFLIGRDLIRRFRSWVCALPSPPLQLERYLSAPLRLTRLATHSEDWSTRKQTVRSAHSVLPEDYVSPVLEAPSFQAVAETKVVTRLALTAFLQTPHADMPNLVVTGEDADNVIAYILSLKGAAAAGLR